MTDFLGQILKSHLRSSFNQELSEALWVFSAICVSQLQIIYEKLSAKYAEMKRLSILNLLYHYLAVCHLKYVVIINIVIIYIIFLLGQKN